MNDNQKRMILFIVVMFPLVAVIPLVFQYQSPFYKGVGTKSDGSLETANGTITEYGWPWSYHVSVETTHRELDNTETSYTYFVANSGVALAATIAFGFAVNFRLPGTLRSSANRTTIQVLQLLILGLVILILLSQFIAPLFFGEEMIDRLEPGYKPRSAKILSRIALQSGFYAMVPSVVLVAFLCHQLKIGRLNYIFYVLMTAIPWIGPIAMIRAITILPNPQPARTPESENVNSVYATHDAVPMVIASGNEQSESDTEDLIPFGFYIMWCLIFGAGLPIVWMTFAAMAFPPQGPNSWGAGLAQIAVAFLLFVVGGLFGLCMPRFVHQRRKS